MYISCCLRQFHSRWVGNANAVFNGLWALESSREQNIRSDCEYELMDALDVEEGYLKLPLIKKIWGFISSLVYLFCPPSEWLTRVLVQTVSF